jgi:hypothetical protein
MKWSGRDFAPVAADQQVRLFDLLINKTPPEFNDLDGWSEREGLSGFDAKNKYRIELGGRRITLVVTTKHVNDTTDQMVIATEAPMKLTTVGQVIATRSIRYNGSDRLAYVVKIGLPQQFPDSEDCYCPVQIVGESNAGEVLYSAGIDSVQALQLAMKLVGGILFRLNQIRVAGASFGGLEMRMESWDSLFRFDSSQHP